MNIHRRAKTCPESRALLVCRVVEEAWSMDQASRAAGVSRQTARKWVRRFLSEGEAGLLDRSSRPHRSPRKLPASREALVVHLRRQHRLTAQALAELTGIPRSTLGRVLRRNYLSRARDLEPKPVVVRYERQASGELIHLDIKKLGRIDGVGHRIHGDRTQRSRGIGWQEVQSGPRGERQVGATRAGGCRWNSETVPGFPGLAAVQVGSGRNQDSGGGSQATSGPFDQAQVTPASKPEAKSRSSISTKAHSNDWSIVQAPGACSFSSIRSRFSAPRVGFLDRVVTAFSGPRARPRCCSLLAGAAPGPGASRASARVRE